MNRPIQTIWRQIYSAILCKVQGTRAFSILITLTFFTNFLNGQISVDCNATIGCNRYVQISLDDNCEILLEPDMILEGPIYPDEYYDVRVKLPNGTFLPQIQTGMLNGSPILRTKLTSLHVGMTIEVSVSLRGCGNSCWGYALIKDKIAPTLVSCPCEPIISQYSGVLTSGLPTYLRPVSCALVGSTSNVNYTTHQFAVDNPGVVNIASSTVNATIAVYEGAFDPNNPCINQLTTNVSSYALNALTGIDYTVVVSYTNPTLATFPIGYNLFFTSPNVDVKSSTTASICVRSCTNEAAIKAQTVNTATTPPVFLDNCGPVVLTKRDEVEEFKCSDKYLKVIKRYWTATDVSGNVNDNKVQYFYLEKPILADVRCPDDWERSCTANFTRLSNGAPHPDFSGYPTNTGCKNIQVLYDDKAVINICGGGIKVLREWTVIDWCTGAEYVCEQKIKVYDENAPTLVCPQDLSVQNTTPAFSVFVDKDRCLGVYPVLPPSSVTDCSKVTWEVEFAYANADGSRPAEANFSKTFGATSVMGTRPAFATTISPTARPYNIINLSKGRVYIKYKIFDECGNEANCYNFIEVIDRHAPTAICDKDIIVGLDNNGQGALRADTLNNFSNDNCDPILEVFIRRKTSNCNRPEDLTFGEYVKFCCNDIGVNGGFVPVVLRVYDSSGNYNECEVDVKVESKLGAPLTCPANVTLPCGDSRIGPWIASNQAFDTVFFGAPRSDAVCNLGNIGSRIVRNELDPICKTGFVDKEYFLISNPNIKCVQRLTVTPVGFDPSLIRWPSATLTIPTCNLNDVTPDALNSKPIYLGTCGDYKFTKTDEIFENVDGVCIKVVRTWALVDWCQSPNTGVLAYYTQKIQLTGEGGPTFQNCTNQVYDAPEGRCDTEVHLRATAQDLCSTNNYDLSYVWNLDLNNDGLTDETGFGNSVYRTLPRGNHRITFTATNRCGSSSSCTYTVTILSNKKPTPICYREVIWVIGQNGTTEVWASDFDLKSENNCGDNSKLKFYFDEAGTQAAKWFSCADIPNGQVARIPLRMYVFDEHGRFDFCEVTLVLQDSPITNACVDNNFLLPSISGQILTEDKIGVEEAKVSLFNENNQEKDAYMSNEIGMFEFNGVDVFEDKIINSVKNGDFINGVSTLDLILIQRHILDIQKLSSPYKLIAADVNGSKSITATDLSMIRRLILGINTDFGDQPSWKFVPENHEFADPTYPYDYPVSLKLDSIKEDIEGMNFIAIKLGDVNNSMIPNSQNGAIQNRNFPITISTKSVDFEKGQIFRLPISINEDLNLLGGQLAMEFDSKLVKVNTVSSNVLKLTSEAISSQDGILKILMESTTPIELAKGTPLFEIEFVALKEGSMNELTLNTAGFTNELYDANFVALPLMMTSRSEKIAFEVAVHQNIPNPFSDNTIITIEVEKENEGTLKIMNTNGSVVFSHNQYFDKGIHHIKINRQQLGANGIYYYQLEMGNFVTTRKMVMIE